MSKLELTEEVCNKWQEIVENENAPKLTTELQKRQMIHILESTERTLMEEHSSETGNVGNISTVGGNANFTPILMAMMRRTYPTLMGNQWFGSQPMSGPTGLVFIMRNYKVVGSTGVETEVFDQRETDKSFSGRYSTANGEALGRDQQVTNDGVGTDPVVYTSPWNEMRFKIEKVTVTAETRALKASYSRELEQDLRNVHGLNAETELSTMLSTEISAEMDREFLDRIINGEDGTLGAAVNAGTFDLDTDTDGRWAVEKYKALVVKIEREANKITRGTRRGKGNFIITSADLAGALNMAGKIDSQNVQYGSFEPNTAGVSYVGVLAGSFRVYVDPYALTNYVLVGYKGSTIYDAGHFFCPYVGLEYMTAVSAGDFNKHIGFKQRYGLLTNPFAAVKYSAAMEADTALMNYLKGSEATAGSGASFWKKNQYYRIFTVTGL